MSLELWILLVLVAAAAAVGIGRRLTGAGKSSRDKETKNVYPLW